MVNLLSNVCVVDYDELDTVRALYTQVGEKYGPRWVYSTEACAAHQEQVASAKDSILAEIDRLATKSTSGSLILFCSAPRFHVPRAVAVLLVPTPKLLFRNLTKRGDQAGKETVQSIYDAEQLIAKFVGRYVTARARIIQTSPRRRPLGAPDIPMKSYFTGVIVKTRSELNAFSRKLRSAALQLT